MIKTLERSEGSASRPGRSLPPGRPGTHCTGDWVGPQGQSGQARKISPPSGFDPQTVQPVASRYTHYATRATSCLSTPHKLTVAVSPLGEKWMLYRNNQTVLPQTAGNMWLR